MTPAIFHPELPSLPTELVEEVVRIIREDANVFPFNNDRYNNFSSYHATEPILAWTSQYFDPTLRVMVRTITGGSIPRHSDIDNTRTFNYLVDAGGDDVHTRWYTGLEPHALVVADYVFPSSQWIELLTDQPHSVEGVEPGCIRIMLSVLNTTPLNRRNYRDQRDYFERAIK